MNAIKTWFEYNLQTLFGLICLQLRQHVRARTAFTRSIVAMPTSAAYCGLGITFLRQDNYESAINSFWAALELEPNNEYDAKWLNWAVHLYSHGAAAVPGCRHCVH
jgi:lipoprotein NlpI